MSATRELILSAGPDATARALDFVASICRAWRVQDDVCFDILLAVDEAVSNIINHGYGGRGGVITLRLGQREGDVIISLVDRGAPFDPTQASEPDLSGPLASRETGGMGICLMRKMMDAIRYCREGEENVLTLIKKEALP